MVKSHGLGASAKRPETQSEAQPKAQSEAQGAAEQLFELMLSLQRKTLLRDPLAAACEDLHFTPAQLHAVVALHRDGPLTMGELAHRASVSEKNITGIVDRLESANVVKRLRDDSDRRVIRVILSELGSEQARTLETIVLDRLTLIMGVLDNTERKFLFRITEKMMGLVDQMPTSRGESK